MDNKSKYNPEIHHRRSIRLKGYDYSQEGAYFITICTHDRECLFGEIVNGEMRLNPFGEIVRDEWLKTPTIRPNIELAEWVIMPNHIHGIVIITVRRGELQFAPTGKFQSPSQTIGAIVRGFKGAATKRINNIRMNSVPVWQRNYWEHIIRNEESYHRIAEYIVNNPLNWQNDTLHSAETK